MLFEKIEEVYVGCPICNKELRFSLKNIQLCKKDKISCPICNLDLPDEARTAIDIAQEYNQIVMLMEKMYEEYDTIIFE